MIYLKHLISNLLDVSPQASTIARSYCKLKFLLNLNEFMDGLSWNEGIFQEKKG